MAEYLVAGGRPLHGCLTIQGAKNAALPLLAAALLPPESRIARCPRLRDTEAAAGILRSLGCRVRREGDSVLVDARPAGGWEISEGWMREMRSSVIFLGAILTRFGRARVSYPGGCELGPRPIDLHLMALRRLGAVIREDHGTLECTVPGGRLSGAEVVLPFPSVGATQNTLIAAALAAGRTVLRGGAREPEIDDLAAFLNAAGARIRRESGGEFIIDGVEALRPVEHRVIPDRIAAVTYLCCCAAAGGEIELWDCLPDQFAAALPCLEAAGCRLRRYPDALRLTAPERLSAMGWIKTLPYPGFPTDAQAPVMAVAAIGSGTTVFTETIFESRFRHAAELARMGADIRTEGRVAIVTGVPALHGAPVVSTDLRGGAALVVAALAAAGESRIGGISHIERGYEELDHCLQALGADITRSEPYEKEEKDRARPAEGDAAEKKAPPPGPQPALLPDVHRHRGGGGADPLADGVL